MGIGRGDRVAIVLTNGLEPIVSFLAVAASGATAAPPNPAYTKEELRFCLVDTNAKALIRSATANDEISGAVTDSIFDITVFLDENGRICFESNVRTRPSWSYRIQIHLLSPGSRPAARRKRYHLRPWSRPDG